MTRARNSANLASDGNLFVNISDDRTGIGSISPTHKLHVEGHVKGNDFFGNLFSVANEGKVVSTSTSGLQLQATAASKPIIFYTNVSGNTERMRISHDGKVGIGLDAPTSTLHVSGTNDVVTIEGSGSTIFEVEGSQGQLFSVTDTLSGSLFSVSDISGMPILEVDSADRVTMGSFGSDTLVVTGSQVLVSTSTLSTVSGVSLSVSGSIQLANDSSFIYDNGGQNIIGVNGSTVTLGSTGNTSVTLPYSTLQIGTINGTNTDHDKFLVSHSGTVKFVSGSQLRSQIGAQASGNYVNDGGGSTNAIAVWSNGTTISGSNTFIMSGGHLSFAQGSTAISGSDSELVLNSQADDINVKIQGHGAVIEPFGTALNDTNNIHIAWRFPGVTNYLDMHEPTIGGQDLQTLGHGCHQAPFNDAIDEDSTNSNNIL